MGLIARYFPDTEDYVPSRRLYLAAVAEAAGIASPSIVANADDERLEMIGSLHGLDVRVELDRDGGIRRATLTHHATFVDLALVRERGADRVALSPQVFVGSQRGAEAFAGLPEPLRQRVLADLPRLAITSLDSRGYRHDLAFARTAREVDEPVAWLADALRLAADVARARGARSASEVAEAARAIAVAGERLGRELAAQPGAALMRDDHGDLEIRWTLDGAPVQVAIDLAHGDVGVAVTCGAPGDFELYWSDEDEEPEPTDTWFGPRLTTSIAWVEDAAASAAIVHALPPALLAELGAAMAASRVTCVALEDGVLDASLDPPPGRAEVAQAWARLLVQVARALPRTPIAPTPPDAACDACEARYYRDAGACPRCGAPG